MDVTLLLTSLVWTSGHIGPSSRACVRAISCHIYILLFTYELVQQHWAVFAIGSAILHMSIY